MASSAKKRTAKGKTHKGVFKAFKDAALLRIGHHGNKLSSVLFPGPNGRKGLKEDGPAGGGAPAGVNASGTGGFGPDAPAAGPRAGAATLLGGKKKHYSDAADTLPPHEETPEEEPKPVQETYYRNILEKKAHIDLGNGEKVKVAKPPRSRRRKFVVEKKILKSSILDPIGDAEKKKKVKTVDFTNVQNGDGRQI